MVAEVIGGPRKFAKGGAPSGGPGAPLSEAPPRGSPPGRGDRGVSRLSPAGLTNETRCIRGKFREPRARKPQGHKKPGLAAGPGVPATSAAMPATPVAASVTVLPPAFMPAGPAVAPRTPLVGIPAVSPPEADAGRNINANGRARRFAPVAPSRAAPVGACRQSKSDAERQDDCREKRFHAPANAGPRRIPPKDTKKPGRSRAQQDREMQQDAASAGVAGKTG